MSRLVGSARFVGGSGGEVEEVSGGPRGSAAGNQVAAGLSLWANIGIGWRLGMLLSSENDIWDVSILSERRGSDPALAFP